MRIWNLVAGILLTLILLARYGASLAAGHMPSMEPKDLALDGCLLVFAVSRFMRFIQPNLPIARALRMFGLLLFFVYLGLKVQH
jgi:hypothetical protein